MKNIILIIFLFFIYSCGYTSVYKDFKNRDFQISIAGMQGNKQMNNLIKNEIKLYSNQDSLNKYDIKINTEFSKKVLAKNQSGEISDYELSANTTIEIYFNEKVKKVSFSEVINISNQTDAFDQDLYEKSIKKNFASSIREKLISEIVSIKW